MCFFFFSSRRRHTRWTGDWSSDVCSSDLVPEVLGHPPARDHRCVSVALPPEVRHEDRRQEELHQRSAEEADELSEHTEQGMPDLVDREVEAVEPAVVAGVENQ